MTPFYALVFSIPLVDVVYSCSHAGSGTRYRECSSACHGHCRDIQVRNRANWAFNHSGLRAMCIVKHDMVKT